MRWDLWFQGNPWQEMDRLLQEIDEVSHRAIPGFSRKSKGDFPAVNLWSDEERVLLTAQLPGVDPKDLDITAKEDTVSIQGKRQLPDVDREKFVYHRQERKSGEFKRVLRLPYAVNPEKVEARYERGILQIVLPRAEKDRPKKIAVSV